MCVGWGWSELVGSMGGWLVGWVKFSWVGLIKLTGWLFGKSIGCLGELGWIKLSWLVGWVGFG